MNLQIIIYLLFLPNCCGVCNPLLMVKSNIPNEECWWGAHLPCLDLEPVGR